MKETIKSWAPYLDKAREMAQKGNCKKRNYGCLIVNPCGTIIAQGCTHSHHACDKCKRRFSRRGHGYDKCTSLHAEQMCVAGTAIPYGSIAVLACYDAKTGEEIRNPRPCATCARLLKFSGVVQVVTNTEVLFL